MKIEILEKCPVCGRPLLWRILSCEQAQQVCSGGWDMDKNGYVWPADKTSARRVAVATETNLAVDWIAATTLQAATHSPRRVWRLAWTGRKTKMVRILALDPGEETGFAFIDFAEQKMILQDHGVIPVTSPGLGGLLWSVWHWLELKVGDDLLLVFEEFILAPKMRTTKEAAEVRGAIRLFGTINIAAGTMTSYYPQSVRAALGLKNKKEIRAFIQNLLGFKIRGKDHVTDAIAIGMCHAVKLGLWYPNKYAQEGDFSLTRNIGGKQTSSDPDELAKLRGPELAAAIKSGKVRFGK